MVFLPAAEPPSGAPAPSAGAQHPGGNEKITAPPDRPTIRFKIRKNVQANGKSPA